MSTENRRVVVAGGSGFIGRSLCRALLASGYEVVALTRGPSRNPSVTPDGPLPSFVTWDARTRAGWGHLADGAFALVNLAGEDIVGGRWTPERKRSILESRVFAGQALAQAVAEASKKPEVLVQSSGIGYYGDTGDKPVDESSPPGQGFLTDICLQWEASTQSVEALGVRRVIIRTGLVLGSGGGVLEKMLPPFKWFLGGAFGDGRQGFPWIHMEDEVKAIVYLMENSKAYGPYNLTAPEAVSNREFCQYLGNALSRPCRLTVPSALLKLVFGEMARGLFLTGCRAFPKRLMELGYIFQHSRLSEALKDLLP